MDKLPFKINYELGFNDANEKLSLPYDFVHSKTDFIRAGLDSKILSLASLQLFSTLTRPSLNSFDFNILAALATLFYRYSNQTQIPLTLAVHEKLQSPVTARLFNLCLDANQSFDSFAESIQTGTNNHIEIDFLNNQQDFVLIIHQAKSDKTIHSDIEISRMYANALQLDIFLSSQDVQFRWQYDQNSFERTSVESIAGHLVNLLEANQAEQTICQLKILDNNEINWLLQVGNGEKRAPCFNSVISAFESNVAQFSESVAVQYNDQKLNYLELNKRSNQLAHLLLQMDVAACSKVVVFVEPGLEILISILAVFKCGATYVPLDPSFPDARLKIILQDVCPLLIITQEKWLGRLSQFDLETLTLSELDSELLALPISKPNTEYCPTDTASIFYTSGTTGKPKGVMASFQNVNHYLSVAHERYNYNQNDVIPAMARFTFSISLFELLSPILAGGTLRILDREDILDFPKMLTVLQQVTAAHIGPSLLKALVSQIQCATNFDASMLRHISSGGDMISPELLNDLQSIFPQSEIHVIYGCSEISCMGVTKQISHNKKLQRTYLGKPFPNVKVRVLDDDYNLLPRGIIGNVCFAGAGLVKGYLNLTELTDEKFFNYNGERFYYTGDRGRLNQQGDLELLGRRDFQIQLRGIRIELGEIEATLRKIPGIKEGIIAQKASSNGEQILMAYVVYSSTHCYQSEEIRQLLMLQLPDYMIPQQVIVLKQLPLNHNFKVDRSLLPAPLDFNTLSKEAVVASTPMQKQIANIWQTILKLDVIDINQNFFTMGGDSIDLAKAIATLQTEHTVTVGLAQLFSHANIADWEQLISKQNTEMNLLVVADYPPIVSASPPTSQEEQSFWLAPASYTQMQFWYMYLLNPSSCQNNIPALFSISGQLNLNALQKTFDILLERHPMLRTSFMENEEGLVQSIDMKGNQIVVHQQILDSSYTQTALEELIAKTAFKSFDLSTAPLMRVDLFQTSLGTFYCLICFHHIIIDQTSITQLETEIEQIYSCLILKKAIDYIPPKLTYADYAIWQNSKACHNRFDAQLSFWKQQLSEVSLLLDFPLDYPRTQLNVGSDYNFTFEHQTSKEIEFFAQQNSASIYVVLLAAYSIILHRYTQQSEIIVGTPFANRNQQLGLQDVIGCFINTLPIVTRINECDSFLDVLEKVKLSVYQVAENQGVPMELIIQEIKPERAPFTNPIYQVGLTFQDAPLLLNLEGCVSAPIELTSQESQLDFITRLWHEQSSIHGVITYNAAIFQESSIADLISHFQSLLSSAIKSPAEKVVDLNIFSNAQVLQMQRRNQTEKTVNEENVLLSQFEHQVSFNPNATALVFEGQQLSYFELNRRSEKLAQYLIQQGLRKDSLVGVLTYRSIEMIVAIYAVLKSGCAYVPIDPLHPVERIQFIIDETEMDFMLTHRAATAKSLINVQVVCLDEDWKNIERCAKIQLPKCDVQQIAYVIYTSGSTGRPKGVMVSHAAALNSFYWMQQHFNLTSADVILFKTPFTFDVSVWELFWPLMHGAKMVIASVDGHSDPDYLKQTVLREGVTFLNFVPSMLQMFLEQQSLLDCPSLRYVLSGGELLTTQLEKQFHAASHAQLYNGYGPTEAGICVSLWPCNNSLDNNVIPIGFPMPNTTFYIFDSNGYLQPMGAIGELYIAGRQLAHGYVKQPQLTLEKFVEKIIDGETVRMYRTGDLVRQLFNGAIVYIGRTDFQIKLRGLRIELGEIEKTIALYPSITQVQVILKSLEHASHLVAYYTSDKGPIDEQMLLDFCKSKLPLYMLPSRLIHLTAMPLNASGKFDRKQLPAFDFHTIVDKSEYVEPANATEKTIAAIWRSLLKTDNISTNASFFSLGGHSLLATQMRTKVNKQLDLNFPLKLFMENPTIKGLANSITNSEQTNDIIDQRQTLAQFVAQSQTPIKSQLSFAQQRLHYLDRLDPKNPVYNIPFAYRLIGELKPAMLNQAIQLVLQNHDSLRTQLAHSNGKDYQHIVELHENPLKQIDLSVELNLPNERHSQLQELMQYGFDLANEPLIQFYLLKESEFSHLIFINAHHTIFDGWSATLLFSELNVSYQQLLAGDAVSAKRNRLQYVDYSNWQRTWLGSKELEKDLAYWKQQLSGPLPILELPLDKQRKKQFSYHGFTSHFNFGSEILQQLSALAKQQNVTLYMVLLSYYFIFLVRHTNQKDIVIGTPIANRHHADTEKIIGYFANTLAMRLNAEALESFHDILDLVKKTCLEAFAHQDIPFEQLVNAVHVERNLSYTPIFQTMFLFTNEENPITTFAGLGCESLQLNPQVAHTDLSFEVSVINQELRLSIEYCSDLFDESTIQLFADRFKILLSNQIDGQPISIDQLALLTDCELENIERWNRTEFDFSKTLNLDQLLLKHSQLNPESFAITDNDTRLSYAQLERQVNFLVHYLQQNFSLEEGSLVAIGVARNHKMLVCMLAILRTGCAYLPLDPSYPLERIKYVMDDANCQLLLSDQSFEQLIDGYNGERVLIDELDFAEPITVINNIAPYYDGNRPAYSIYTSGSTGKPKGVLITQKNVLNFLNSMAKSPGMDSNDKCLAITTISFDIAVLELFLPLFVGAEIILLDRHSAADAKLLAEKISQHKVSFMQATPATWSMLINSDWQPDQPIKILCGGEAMHFHLASALLQQSSQVWNMYGPTETTVWSSIKRINKPEDCQMIGKPIDNTQMYILNSQNAVQPVGVSGELCIAGDGVSPGYIGRDDLTQQKFTLVNLIKKIQPEEANLIRLYRTGDRVRQTNSGDIEYLERMDNQVKIRGYRIELSEIENAILSFEGLTDAVCITHSISPTDIRLCAFVMTDKGKEVLAADLKLHLAKHLPNFMIPQYFLFLDHFPMTPNGKVDKKALPDLTEIIAIQSKPELSAASTEKLAIKFSQIQSILAEIWCSSLLIDEVDIHDNFFDLGGHSLLSIQVIEEIKKQLNVEITAQDILMNTLAQIAVKCELSKNQLQLPPKSLRRRIMAWFGQ